MLHNYEVREMIAGTITFKNETVEGFIQKAIEAGEITDDYSPKELTMLLYGIVYSVMLNRRVTYHEKSLKAELTELIDKTLFRISKNQEK